jgi:hypothetical protein
MGAAKSFTAARSKTQAPTPPAALLGRQAFFELERWLYGSDARSLGLQEIEVEEERRGREMLRVLLQAHIDGRGNGDIGAALRVVSPEDPNCELLYTHKRLHTRRLITIFGTVSISRFGYGKAGRSSIHPLDPALQLPSRTYSYEIQRRLVKAAIQGPFDEALEAIADATGVGVPKRSAEQIVIDASVDFESFYARRAGSFRTPQGPILVASIDSKGIPMVKPQRAEKKVRLGKGEKRNKKRMSTVAAVFTQQPDVRTPEEVVESLFSTADDTTRPKRRSRAQHKRVWASLLTDKSSFIADVREEMLRRDRRHRKAWIVVTDGERALQLRVCRMLKSVVFVLDLFHVLEKLWAASYALHPEGSPQAEAFVRKRALWILSGKVSQVVKGLRQSVTKRRLKAAKRKTLLGVAGYYYRNRLRMHYDEYLRGGLPIASGSVEGACKNLIKDRMERSGMRWTPAMAEAMLRLRATYLSEDFDEYWSYHVNQEQQRLYPEGQWRPQVSVVRK